MISLEDEIRRAFDEDEFFPVFQPLVELRTGRLIGFEALARWRHRRLGELSPGDFIPILEKNQLIHELTFLILEKSFASPVFKDSSLTLAVNVSPVQLLGLDPFERLASVAAQGGFALDRLTIEITESALMDDLQRAQTVTRQLKELKCRLALDDFGTGYSSLRHLHELPFDELKVDQSFVSSMAEKRESRKIVAAVLGLGQSLGLTTVAEGVETQEQADMLLWLGCDVGQGWLFGKPVQLEELPRMASNIWRSGSISKSVLFTENSISRPDMLPEQRLAQLQAIYDAAPVGLCFLDRDMRYVSLNRRLSEINGVPAADHLGRTVAEVIPQMYPLVEPLIRRSLHGESVSGFEVTKPPAEGQTEGQTILLSYQPARDEAGEVLGVCVAIMDMTATRRTEEALRETEDHYRHMMHLGPHVPWVLDAKGELIEASPRWEEFTGQAVEEALGNGWLNRLHPADVAPTRVAIQKMLRAGMPIDIEYRICKPGQEWKWMRSRGSPRFGPGGKIIYVYGVVEEIHEREESSIEINAHQAAMHTTLDAMPYAIVLADASDCSIFMVNAAAQELFGEDFYPGQRIDQYSQLRFTCERGGLLRAEEFPLVRAAMHGESIDAMQMTYENRAGLRIPLRASSHPIFADNGQLIGGVAMMKRMDAGC